MEIKYIYGLTPLQEGMLFQKLIAKDSSRYHNQDAVWIKDEINLEQFKQALKLLVEKHEAIGASFVVPNSTGIPRQVFFKERELECTYLETKRTDIEEYIKEIKEADLKRGFDLQKDCLMRALITYFESENKYYVLVSHHHIIMDGWCMNIVFGDLLKYYNMLRSGESYETVFSMVQSEKESSSNYIEYLKWLSKLDRKESLSYWSTLLEGYENVAQIVPLHRKSTEQESVKELCVQFQKEECELVKMAGRQCSVTMNSIFEAAWGVLLQKYNYLDDVVFGKVVSGRNVPIRGVEQTVGLFINTIPCRVTSTPDMSVKELLKNVQNQAATSTSYDSCPLFEIQKLTSQREDLIKTLISFEYGDTYQELTIEQESTREETDYDINLSFFMEHNRIALRFIYNPRKYTMQEMNRLFAYYKNLVLRMAKHPEEKIGELSVLSEEQQKDMLECSGGEKVNFPNHECLATIFQRQVKERPDDIAVTFEEESLSYEELNKKANQIAAELRKQGVSKQDRVVILSKRCIDIIIGILGIQKLGASYVPVDISYPKERRNLVISDCAPKAVLTCGVEVELSVPVISLDEFSYEEEAEEICVPSDPDDIVYIIYTSGTSGTSKGVMVAQHSVLNLVFTENYANLTEKTHLLQTGQLAFDASTFEIWGSLLHGARLYMIEEDTLLNCQKLKEYIRKHKISGFFITTTLFNQLVIEDVELFDTLEWVLFGGEKASEDCVYKLRKHNKSINLRNIYGPTEGTTFAVCYKVSDTDGILPIGRPIPNVDAYVRNQDSLCGIGMVGELCIAGQGIARGYLMKQELTKQKFIKNPYGDGTMYLTGDLVRWNEDGEIEYISRLDQQVKIHGFRIELGDIDNAMRNIEEVKDVYVTARNMSNGEKVLCAYVVLAKSILAAHIIQKLEKELPSYMVPKHIVFLDELPVTKNGKINQEELPDIEIQSTREYVEPRNEVEQTIADIFKEILGVEKVGATDSFFELGGDSIKAIRVVSKMRQASYEISVSDILKYHIVEEIAQRVFGNSMIQYEQGEVTGEVVKTPVIREFLQRNLKKPSHYNQSIMVRLDTEDEEMVCNVLGAITSHHDILRSTLKEGRFILHSHEELKGYELTSFDYKNDLDYVEKMEDSCNAIQSSISLENGPLVKAGLFKTVEGCFLMLCIHHLVVDGVSWRILTEDLITAFSQGKNGEEIVLPAKTASFIEWSKALKEYEESDSLKAELPYWTKVVKQEWPASYETNIPNGIEANMESTKLCLGKEVTSLLMKDANRAYHTETRDLLLAAFDMALQEIAESDKIVIGLEGHGREEIHKKISIDRTVGWFTSIYPMVLDRQDSMESSIIQVKNKLRSIPSNGIGYGLLKHHLEEKKIPVLFNFLGEMDAERDKDDGYCSYSTGINVAKENVFCELTVDNVIEGKQLQIEVCYDASKYQKNTVEKLLNRYGELLKEVAAFCVKKKESRRTGTDYTGGQIDEKDLQEIYKCYSDEQIQDIYPLSPLQEGMLFHNMLNQSSTDYVVQTVFRVPYEINVPCMERALKLLMRRFDVLRTTMFHHNTSMPLQIVLKDRKPDIREVNLLEFNLRERAEVFETLKKYDVDRGFQLDKDALVRLTVIRSGEEENKMFFTIHHIVVDGWSLSLLFCNLFQYYGQLMNEMEEEKLLSQIDTERKQSSDYGQFINWYVHQEKEKALDYWQNVLAGYEESATIEPMILPKKTDCQMNKVEKRLGATVVNQIQELSNQIHATQNSILEMVWGYVLAAYNHTEDVVFGKVVSGRSADVENIENMVGLFINTIPVRFTMKDNAKIEDLINCMQMQADKSRSYDYCGLTEIQGRIGQGSQLIQTLLVFQNFYVDEDTIEKGASQGMVPCVESDREQLNYNISIIVSMDKEQITFSCLYNPNVFMEEEVKYLLDHMSTVLEYVLNHSSEKVSAIDMTTEQEKEFIKNANQTHAEYPVSKGAIKLIEEQVERIPEETALVFHGKKLTYRQLNQGANHLAFRMKEYDIHPDDFVVLITERSIEMMIGILAALKCGGAFVPIAPSYPEERKDYIIGDCKPKVILTYGEDYIEKSGTIPVIKLEQESFFYEEEIVNPQNDVKPEHAAYVLYTSGTTGRPKGVVIENRSIVNYMTINENSILWDIWQSNCRKIASLTNYTFDIFMTESLVSLANGFCIYLTDEEERKNAKKFAALCMENGIEIAQSTPSCIRTFISDPQSHQAFSQLKYIIIGGEKVEWSTRAFIGTVTDAKVINGYGPTEATVYTTSYIIPKEKDASSVSIGNPRDNIKTYIMQGDKLCGVGVPGELYVAGASLARGYLNNQALTDEKFIQNAFGEGRMYRTGDLVKLRTDGAIIYIGRVDDQVKIRGLRIELGEIDSVIREQDEIIDAAVIVRKITEDDSMICAYIISDETVDTKKLADRLAEKLPDYMIPQYITQIEKIPLNASGKLDKRALPFEMAEKKKLYQKPETEKEILLCQTIEEVLGVEHPGVNDDFFLLGGDSLKAIRLISKLGEKGYQVSLQNVMRQRNIHQLSQVLRISADSKEAMEITKYFMIDDRMKVNQKSPAFVKYFDQLEGELSRYDLHSVKDKNYLEYPMNGMQNMSYKMGVRYFAMQLPFCENVDRDKLAAAWCKLKENNDLLNSSISISNDRRMIRVYDLAERIPIPFVDITACSRSEKEEFVGKILEVMERFAQESYYQEDHASVLPILIQFEKERYSLALIGSHMVCDAFSFDIIEEKLLEYYYNDEDIDEKYSYKDIVPLLQNQYVDMDKDMIQKKLELEKFVDTLKSFQNVLQKENYETLIYQVKEEERLAAISTKDRLDISKHLFVDALHYTFENQDIPVGMLHMSRKTKRQNLFHYVGEFLDVVPLVLEAKEQVSIEKKAEPKQIFMEEHNIFFASMLEEGGKILNDALSFMDAVIFYNNTGALSGTDSIQYHPEHIQHPCHSNCETSLDGIRFNAMVKAGEQEQMIEYLNGRLDQYLDDIERK